MLREALVELAKIQGSDELRALGPDMKVNVDAVYDLVQSLSMNVGPRREDISNYGHFFSLVLKRVENFLCFVPQDTVSNPTTLQIVFHSFQILPVKCTLVQFARTDLLFR